jgi:hypothetical protein
MQQLTKEVACFDLQTIVQRKKIWFWIFWFCGSGNNPNFQNRRLQAFLI